MSIAAGTRIGHYEVVAAIGAGGMGEVYRARDSKLKREVAIKVLPADVANDRERLARFQREAEVLASLNHPNIAHLYGIEDGRTEVRPYVEGDGRTEVRPYIVMELVEGEDLAQRIARGAIPLDEALPIAKQIADALEAAHEQGIVHRDLKPANIKVRPDGTVKVLDFGLAKAFQDPTTLSPQDLSASPTLTSAAMTRLRQGYGGQATEAGVILGTAAYMSPEQARGRPVDKRTDIWAFGCVMFEMLTGRKAFEGDTMTDVLGAIVRAEPDWAALPAATPAGVQRLLKRCLQKDQSKRLRDIGDALLDLDPASITADSTPTAAAATRRSPWIAIAVVAVAMAVAAVLTAGIVRRTQPVPAMRVQKLQLNVDADDGTFREPVISPDGTKIAYIGRSRIWIRSLDQWQPRELAGTEAAVRPFWSPDSSWIGYFRSEALLKVPAAGGPVVRVSTLPAVQAPLGSATGAWMDDGTIYVSLATGPLLRVPAGGGEVAPFLDLPSDVAIRLRDIKPLPDRRSLLAVLHRSSGLDAIGVVTDNAVRAVLELEGVQRPTYAAPGHVLFERRAPNAGLWAASFSLDTLTVTGEPFLIGEGTELSAARDGTLSFIAVPENIARRLAWFSLDGAPGASLAEPREWVEGVALSRDQRRLLASAADGLWEYDTETGARSRVTTDPSDITPDFVDSNTIVFVRTIDGQPAVMLKRLGAGSEERVLARPARFPRATSDGTRVVFNLAAVRAGATAATWQVAWIDLDRPDNVHTLPAQHDGARFPAVSPQGTMVAYVSGETGRDEIFLTTLPGGDGKWQVSDGGGWALFHPKGNAVFFRGPDGSFMSVPVADGSPIKVGQARKLFEWGPMWAPFYEIAVDGSRGITAMPAERRTRRTSLSIVQNWQLEFAPR